MHSNAWRRVGRDGTPSAALGSDLGDVVDFLDHIWDHARDVDPDNERDLDPHRHREVFSATVGRVPAVDPALADALYATAPDVWEPYDDTLPVLEVLRRNGIRVAVLSNVGYDLRPVVERTGIAPLLDGLVMSQALGVNCVYCHNSRSFASWDTSTPQRGVAEQAAPASVERCLVRG